MGRCKKPSNSVFRFLGIFFNSMLIKTDEGSEEGSKYILKSPSIKSSTGIVLWSIKLQVLAGEMPMDIRGDQIMVKYWVNLNARTSAIREVLGAR